MRNLRLTILGSASGLPEANRAHAALALHNQKEISLLDAGEGACSSLLRWNLDPLKLRGIFITHTHPDHCVGLFMILQYLHMLGHRGKVRIFLPGEAIPSFQPFLNQLYLVRGQINPDYELLPLRNHHKLTPDWNLETFPTQHLQKWRELNLSGVGAGAYAIRVSAPGHSLFYSGDIADFSDIAEAVQKEDLLILEGAHINLKKVIKWAGENGMERLVLTHLLPEAAPQASALIQEAQKSGLQITLAVDGLTINL